MANNFNKNTCVKYFKTRNVLFVSCFSCLFVQTIRLFNEYMSGKTVTNISVGLISNDTLPAITFCPVELDFAKMSKIDQSVNELYDKYLGYIGRDGTIIPKYIEYEMQDLYLDALTIFGELIDNQVINIMDDLVNNLTPFNEKDRQDNITVIFKEAFASGPIENDLRQSIEHQG